VVAVSALIDLREAVAVAGSAARLRAAIADGSLTPRATGPMRFDRREVAEAVAEPVSDADARLLEQEAGSQRLSNGLTVADEQALAERALTPAEALRHQQYPPHACACLGPPLHGGTLCNCHVGRAAEARALDEPCRWCKERHDPPS